MLPVPGSVEAVLAVLQKFDPPGVCAFRAPTTAVKLIVELPVLLFQTIMPQTDNNKFT
jgi:hypothetical protein